MKLPPLGGSAFTFRTALKGKKNKPQELLEGEQNQSLRTFEFVMILATYEEVKKLYPLLPANEISATKPHSNWFYTSEYKMFAAEDGEPE